MGDVEELDYEVLESSDEPSKPEEFLNSISKCFSGIYLKLIAFLYLIFLFVTSDVFVNKILGRINGAVDYRCPTTKGAFIQGLILVMLFVSVDAVISGGVI